MRANVAVTMACQPCPLLSRLSNSPHATFCLAMQHYAELGKKNVGTEIDSFTTHAGTVVRCNTKVRDFKKRLDVPFNVMKASWQARKQSLWNGIYCNDPIFAQAIKSGWRIPSKTTDAKGSRHYTEAVYP